MDCRRLTMAGLLVHQRVSCFILLAVVLALLLAWFFVVNATHKEEVDAREGGIRRLVLSSKEHSTAFARKILQPANDGDTNRVGAACSKKDIVISQVSTAPLPSGIPTYTVEILNMCVSGCSISNIHVSCGWFSSAKLINPWIFKRISYNDCLVNGGQPLEPGEILSFKYANTYCYPLSVSSVVCD